jgi:hypothetical protein
MFYMGFIFLEWLPSSEKLLPLSEPDPSEYRQHSHPRIYLILTSLLMVAWSFIEAIAGSSGVAKIPLSSGKAAVVVLILM